MEFKFFTDLIDALGKVATGLKTLVQLPKTERETIRSTLDEKYRLIDTTLNMVIIRLGDILLQSSDKDFLDEVARWTTIATGCRRRVSSSSASACVSRCGKRKH